MVKKCSKCGREFTPSMFYTRIDSASGYRSWCKECSRKIYTDEIDEVFNTTDINRRVRRWCLNGLGQHRRKGHIINITIDELFPLALGTTNCEICDKPLNWFHRDGKGGRSHDTPSIDRINNEDNLSIDNVQIVCCECNTTKSNRTMEEFIDYCKRVLNKQEDENYV